VARSVIAGGYVSQALLVVQTKVRSHGSSRNQALKGKPPDLARKGRIPLLEQADVILALEVGDLWGVTGTVKDLVGRPWVHTARADVRVISMNTSYLYGKSNMQDAQRYAAADLPIAADSEASLPGLLQQVEQRMTPAYRAAVRERTPKLRESFDAMRAANRHAATLGWDASPISTARLCQEVWQVICGENWALVSPTYSVSHWPLRLWDFSGPYQFIGAEGGYGVGYGAPAAVGAALAHREAGRIAVNIQNDGDLMTAPRFAVDPCALSDSAAHCDA
jgi:acetolactate synthase I/II/III large subunit